MGPAGTKLVSVNFASALMILYLTGEKVRHLKGFSDLMT